MKPPSGHQALLRVGESLAELLARPPAEVDLGASTTRRNAECVLELGPFRFLVSWKSTGSAAAVKGAVDGLRRGAELVEGVIPLVAVPYMGEVGRHLCEEAGVAWLDLSGNASISASGLRIHVDGRPNRFKRRGRPANVFAPKSSRIARWLLIHAGEAVTQRQLAQETGMDEGFTSRIVARLEGQELLVRNGSGKIAARDPDLLLDAWRETYSFSGHSIVRGHIAARSGEALLPQLAQELRRLDVEHAATGLGGAWLLSHFAAFRTVTFYLHQAPSAELLRELGFRRESRGANVWLAVPSDEGVFEGASEHEGIRTVHPVQVCLDLGGHPERAAEAAAHLRSRLLQWGVDG